MVLGVASARLAGALFLLPTLVLFPIAAGAAFGLLCLFQHNDFRFNPEGHPGSSLGVYSVIVGASTGVGSVVSGLSSLYLGFDEAFILANLLGTGVHYDQTAGGPTQADA